ncbi:substrate-binding domain-containing protein [Bremerella sp. T1]|uniref:substrate-binding domain-containing protein n=1 Tax=Bremerella sp. TYQ1 TaxID=3119568 RepID=UPI001CCF61AE|nr:substrate-binding domain-containing protein [Bremerella volcania]UBM36206.1 substrate-binding domain-containing protein [Bremerella volcania]
MNRLPSLLLVLLVATTFVSCRAKTENQAAGSGGYEFPIEAGKYRILGIRTDNTDHARAKQNAESAIANNPNLKAMVGLWAYNPPMILSAVEGAGKTGEIHVIGFDEDPVTLKGIQDGKVYGTVVQQPFVFGYKSVEFLSALARGQQLDIPESNLIFVPFKSIRQDNVAEFQAELNRIKAGNGTPPPHNQPQYDTQEKVKIAFLTNTVDPFWNYAEEGVRVAEPIFNAECEVYHPPNGSQEEQKRFIERKIGDGCQALAMSPSSPESQTSLINKAVEKFEGNVICHDSDAPSSERKFYIGTHNYLAGREVGRLVKEAIPNGGDVMIFVGMMEQLNAQERSAGVIDELMDKPIPPEIAKYMPKDEAPSDTKPAEEKPTEPETPEASSEESPMKDEASTEVES